MGNQGYVTDGALVGAGLITNLDPYYEHTAGTTGTARAPRTSSASPRMA